MTDHAPGLAVAIVLSVLALVAPSGGAEAPRVVRRTTVDASSVQSVGVVADPACLESDRAACVLSRGTSPV